MNVTPLHSDRNDFLIISHTLLLYLAILGSKRNGLIDTSYRWRDNIVPVQIVEEDFSKSDDARRRFTDWDCPRANILLSYFFVAPEQVEYIRRGMRLLESVSCLRFVLRTEAHTNYMKVIGTDPGCYSYVGQVGGEQLLNLEPWDVDTGCFGLATIQHEFLQALGFYHQQSASDRDEFVDIIWDNISEGAEINFESYPSTMITDFDVRYDYGSVMHYEPMAFTKNGQPTIIPKDPNAVIGQRVGLSERDVSKLNHMYGCLRKT
ncbi:zinc metalloproteinase nas-13-like [Anopheles albimanus]|uniref:zinc metalloproteinase nas-13-like n=1 Tax=Anopheles albimanus TaxID=7167 RepID=UPI00163F3E2D|nr:zinc metalloproteinase nas-13-like [Anopheles albimanus]